MKIRLGKKAASFYDPISGLQLVPGETKEMPTGKRSWVLTQALRGGHVEIVTEDTPAPTPPSDQDEVKDEVQFNTVETLASLTRKEMMKLYNYIDEDHLVIANEKNTKAELAEFLLSIAKEYS